MSIPNLLDKLNPDINPVGSVGSALKIPTSAEIPKISAMGDDLSALQSLIDIPELSDISNLASTAGDALHSHVTDVVSKLPSITNTVAAATKLNDVANKAESLLTGLPPTATQCDLVSSCMGLVNNAAQHLKDIQDAVSAKLESFKTQFTPLFSAISAAAGEVISDVKGMINAIKSIPGAALAALKSELSSVISDIKGSIISSIGDLKTSLTSKLTEIQGAITSEVNSLKKAVTDVTNISFLKNSLLGPLASNPCMQGILSQTIKPEDIPTRLREALSSVDEISTAADTSSVLARVNGPLNSSFLALQDPPEKSLPTEPIPEEEKYSDEELADMENTVLSLKAIRDGTEQFAQQQLQSIEQYKIDENYYQKMIDAKASEAFPNGNAADPSVTLVEIQQWINVKATYIGLIDNYNTTVAADLQTANHQYIRAKRELWYRSIYGRFYSSRTIVLPSNKTTILDSTY